MIINNHLTKLMKWLLERVYIKEDSIDYLWNRMKHIWLCPLVFSSFCYFFYELSGRVAGEGQGKVLRNEERVAR